MDFRAEELGAVLEGLAKDEWVNLVLGRTLKPEGAVGLGPNVAREIYWWFNVLMPVYEGRDAGEQ